MTERKMWREEEDSNLKKLVIQNEKKKEDKKWKWSQIAQQLNRLVTNSHRSGKQCRERQKVEVNRWHNQLDPTIKKNEDWTEKQIQSLYELQDKYGNHWATIAREIPGRTDNNIKNFFYSSLRRAIRRVNSYIIEYKKKSNIKNFKPNLLHKILTIEEQNSRAKLSIKDQQAVRIGSEIKHMLAKLAHEEDTIDLSHQEIEFRQKLIQNIQQFNRKCKKKKIKKNESSVQFEKEQYQEDELISKDPLFQRKKKKFIQSQQPQQISQIQKKISKNSLVDIFKNPSLSESKMQMSEKKSVLEKQDSPILFRRRSSKISDIPFPKQIKKGNSLCDDLFNEPQIRTRRSQKQDIFFELNLNRASSFNFFGNENQEEENMFSFQNGLDPISMNEQTLLKRQSEISKKQSLNQ